MNTGRLTLPAACVGLSKRCLEISRTWAGERVQWGAAIGKHAAIADKIARIAAETFAMEAMTFYAASLVDRDKHADVRLEAAMCKLWGPERTWEHVNEAMQIRGGRGYETAQSLAARGDTPVPIERLLRDSRINTIFEGSSEIMRLFIAREALDTHLKIGAPMLNTQLPLKARAQAGMKATAFYAGWYPRQWVPGFMPPVSGFDSRLASHLRFAAAATRKLARALFHAMARFGPKLEREQVLLGRFVDLGTELFALTAACSRAHALGAPEAIEIADYFARLTRLKIARLFHALHHHADRAGYRLAQRVVAGDYAWLEAGVSAKAEDVTAPDARPPR